MTAHHRITESDLTCVGPVEFLAHRGYRIWKDGRIESDLVRSGDRAGQRSGIWRPVQLSLNGRKYPYFRVSLYAGKVRNACIHSLLMEVFVGPRPPGMEVRHLDGNPLNNRLDNLCYGTHAENMRDAAVHGVMARGEANASSKLDDDRIRTIRRRWAMGESMSKLARCYCVTRAVIGKICHREAWAHVE